MAVTSTTLAGVNVWQFSGSVTDAEIKTAWASLIVNNRYKPGRYIYIDSTCNLLGVRGTYYVDSEALGIILHSSRNKANTLFTNWIFTQTVGLSVGARGNFVRVTNGSTITQTTTDGIDMKGGGMIYAVQGNPGGGDPRFLNEMMFGTLDGTIVTSQAFTEQELQPVSYGTIWRGLNIQKCANIPIVNSGNQVVYRTNFNTEIAIANPISLYSGSNGCFISTVMRKQGATFTSSLANTFASTGTTTIMILNNWRDESYFGASKTTIVAQNWNAGNRFVGGVLKKIQTQPSTLINVYDSRSTTAPAKSTFSETTADFLSGTTGTTTDASTGRASFVVVGAIATGSARTITRYTGQKFTLQKFGYKIQIETPDMTFGDDDLSAFSPITMTAQDGITRSQAAITSATTITSYQELLEELHVLALAQVGAASYNGFNNGNLFNFTGGVLTTNFASVTVDATAASKISYNSTTNALTIKSSVLASNGTVTQWNNASGPITLANGAVIQGVYQSSAGTSTTFQFQDVQVGSSLIIYDASGVTKYFQQEVTTAGTYSYYIAPGTTGTYSWAIEKYGTRRESGSFAANTGGLLFYVPAYAEDVGITQTTKATVAGYTTLETNSKVYDYIAYSRLSEQFIKLGQILTRSGTSLEWITGYNVKVKATNATVFSLTSTTFFIKASSLAGDTKYATHVLVPPATLTADTTEVITTEIEDGNGDSSVTIQAAGVSTFEVWKITDATDPDDYATGTLEDTVGIGKYRFLSANGYKFVIRDQTTNYRVVVEAEKGIYTAELFFGAAVQLAQSAEVSQINTKVDIMQIDLEAIKGTGHVKDKHSLTNIKKKAALAAALSA
jgi:hypothetical protein